MNRSLWQRIGVAVTLLMGFAFGAVFGLLFAAAGVVIPICGWEELQATHDWRHTSVPTSGVVEERHVLNPGDDPPDYESTVIFTTAKGEEASAMVQGDSPPPGSAVTIRYDPARPSLARLSSWGTEWYEFAGEVIAGAVFLAIGLSLIAAVIAAARVLAAPTPPPALPTQAA